VKPHAFRAVPPPAVQAMGSGDADAVEGFYSLSPHGVFLGTDRAEFWTDSARHNHSYFPILVGASFRWSRDELYQKLKEQQIFARRYFYPLISDFPMYRGLPSAQHANLPIAVERASRVLCLPIYPQLSNEDVHRIVSIIVEG